MGPSRQLFERRSWKGLDEKHAMNLLLQCLENLPDIRSPTITNEQLDKYAEELHKCVYEVFDTSVPVVESAQEVIKATSSNARHAHKHVLLCNRDWRQSRTPELKKKLEEAERAAAEIDLIDRENAWNNHIRRTIRHSGGYAKLYRASQRKEQFQETAHMPPLKKTDTSPEITDSMKQCDCLVENLLGVPPSTTIESCRLHLPFEDNPNFTCDALEENELENLVKKIPWSRAVGENSVPNQFLKMFQQALIPKLREFCEFTSH